MSRKILGAVLILSLPWALAGQSKEKKTYELIYQDVQTLKEQVQDLRARVDRSAEDMRAVREELKTLAELVRQFVVDQAAVKDDVRAVPAQYQDLLRRLDQLSLDVEKLSADLAAARPAAPAETPPEKAGREPAPKKPDTKPGPGAPPTPAASAQAVPPASNISPTEAYRMAYNDYLKGNYDLAVESFKLYRQQFPDSPLADNALYWIGECHFSEKRFLEAIDDFNEVIVAYPQGDKVAAAYLKKGISFVELGRKDEALAAFKLLVSKYPLQDEAKIAQDKIRELTEK
ncbi:MAG TPA: tol-pal system protein YbgF [Terriglobales bacterium]|nr:tol-pal system protein YbgF [Terriglobales bacterium]